MYSTGHYGAALLVYAPVGFALASVSPELAVGCGAGVVALASLPDYDLRVPLVSHRGITHTLAFAVAVASVLAGVGWVVGDGQRFVFAAAGALVGLLGVGSHLVADALTPAGVPLLWPLSGKRYSVGVARANNPLANWVLLGLGVGATALVVATVF